MSYIIIIIPFFLGKDVNLWCSFSSFKRQKQCTRGQQWYVMHSVGGMSIANVYVYTYMQSTTKYLSKTTKFVILLKLTRYVYL